MAKRGKTDWKTIRVSILLLILVVVIINNWRDQNQNWNKPIYILLHPINADRLSSTEHYIQQLEFSDFIEIKQYLEQQSVQYRQPIVVHLKLGRTLQDLPPKTPATASIPEIMWWSLRFRYYAWKQRIASDKPVSVTLYLNYYDPQQKNILQHSTALEKGRIGSVNLFASTRQNAQNRIVIAHELLHAFGATDKYNLQDDQPIFPVGYSDSEQQPLYPQTKAELMAGKIPLSEQTSVMPKGLAQTTINPLTAQEIGWLKK